MKFKRKIFFVVAIIIVIILGASSTDKVRIMMAKRYHREGKFSTASKICYVILRKNLVQGCDLNLLAIHQLMLSNLAEIVNVFHQCEISHSKTERLNLSAKIITLDDELERIARKYKFLVDYQIFVQQQEYYEILLYAYEELINDNLGKNDLLAFDLELKIIRKKPSYGHSFTRLVNLAFALNKVYDVLDVLHQMHQNLVLPLEQVAWYKKLAFAFWQKGYEQNATEYLTKYLKDSPTDKKVRYQLGLMYLKMDKKQEALTHFKKIFLEENELGSVSKVDCGPWAYFLMAEDAEKNGDIFESIGLFKEVINRDKWFIEAYEKLIILFDKADLADEKNKIKKIFAELEPQYKTKENFIATNLLGYSYEDADFEMGGRTFVKLFFNDKKGERKIGQFLLSNLAPNPSFNIGDINIGIPEGYRGDIYGASLEVHKIIKVNGVYSFFLNNDENNTRSNIESDSIPVLKTKIYLQGARRDFPMMVGRLWMPSDYKFFWIPDLLISTEHLSEVSECIRPLDSAQEVFIWISNYETTTSLKIDKVYFFELPNVINVTEE